MAVYKMQIQYDGRRYNGWQRQGSTDNTIQRKIEETLGRILSEDVEIKGAGRTDAGVHAIGQVAGFHTRKKGDVKKWMEELNRYLPKDIRILSLEKAEERFHARLSAKGKTYRYVIDNGPVADVFSRAYSMRVESPLSVERMEKAAELLTGTHDYKAFCGNPRMKKSTVRTVDSIRITKDQGKIQIEYHGDGFLFHMVRILTGTLIEVGQGIKEPEEIPKILEGLDRQRAGFCAESQGLFLVEVDYR